jgi:Ca2+-binding EF-hand superfamily protein
MFNEESQELKETFTNLDLNRDGRISKDELYAAYVTSMGADAAKQEVERTMAHVDIDGSGYIDYSEFITA